MSVSVLTNISYPKGASGSGEQQIDCRAYNYYVDGQIFGPSGDNLINYQVKDVSGVTGINGNYDISEISNADGSIFVRCAGTTAGSNDNLQAQLNEAQASNAVYFNPNTGNVTYGPGNYPIIYTSTPVAVTGSGGNLQILNIPSGTFNSPGEVMTFRSWGKTASNSSASIIFSFQLGGVDYSLSSFGVSGLGGNYSLSADVMLTSISGSTGTFDYNFVFNYSESDLTNPYISTCFNNTGVTLNIANLITVGSYVAVSGGTSNWTNNASKAWFN
jgi:hypothetical protein